MSEALNQVALAGRLREERRLAEVEPESVTGEEPHPLAHLPLAERRGWLIWLKERTFFELVASTGPSRLLSDERFRPLVIEAMRQGPRTTVRRLSEATGVPRGTITGWASRFEELGAALQVLREGAIAFLRMVEAGELSLLGAIERIEAWPEPRNLHLDNKTEWTQEDQRSFREGVLTAYAQAGKTPPTISDEPPEGWTQAEVEDAYRVVDRHWRCDPPCTGPHLEGEPPVVKIVEW